MSWNIQWGRGADGRVDLQRTIGALRALGSLDVICLQEVAQGFPGLPGGDRGDDVALLTAAFPDHEAVYGAAVDVPDGAGGRARFGNLLLSRHPVGQVFRHLLPNPADPSVPGMQRICVEAVIDGAGGPVRVLTTHLEYYSAVQRRAQIDRLCELQREALGHARGPAATKESNPSFRPWPRPEGAVLCGDFNCEPGSAEHAALLARSGQDAAVWHDAWQLAHPGVAHAPSVGLHGAEWPDRPYCCDFFLVSDALAARVRDVSVCAATAASDHQPVVLQLAD